MNYTTNSGSAIAGTDFTPASGTLTFADGQATATITIPITPDVFVEGIESFTFTLSGPTGGAALSTLNTAVLTIIETDPEALGLTGFASTATGYIIRLNRPIVTGDLNLYDGQGSSPATGTSRRDAAWCRAG